MSDGLCLQSPVSARLYGQPREFMGKCDFKGKAIAVKKLAAFRIGDHAARGGYPAHREGLEPSTLPFSAARSASELTMQKRRGHELNMRPAVRLTGRLLYAELPRRKSDSAE